MRHTSPTYFSIFLLIICVSTSSYSRTEHKICDCCDLSLDAYQSYYKNNTHTPALCLKQLIAHAKQYMSYNIFTQIGLAKDKPHLNTEGALYGVAIAVKDNIDVSGFITSAGTPGLKKNLAMASSNVVRRLQRQGALVLGKTNMHELAAGVTSNNYYYGPVRNPYDCKKFAGGSSGGSAVAVRLGIVPIALGTDTAGSTRIPAALSGVVGFRPSTGRYATDGVVPASHTLDTIGILARTVRDIDKVDRVIIPTNSIRETSLSHKTIRLGMPHQFFMNIDQQSKPVISAFIKRLKEHNIKLITFDANRVEPLVKKIAFPIVLYELRRDMTAYLQTLKNPITFTQLTEQIASPDVKALFHQVATTKENKVAYAHALKVLRPKLIKLYQSFFKEYRLDAIVFPTTKLPARNILGSLNTVELNGRKIPSVDAYTLNSEPAAIAGLPSLSIPIGLTKTGLPVGIELDGLRGSDRQLLNIGVAIQKLIPPLIKKNKIC